MARRHRRHLAAQTDTAPPTDPGVLEDRLADLVAARTGTLVRSRADALQLPVVMRARDVLCGTLSALPFKRTRADGVELGAGWLERPDPNHTRGWFVAQVTEDLFFHGHAFAWVTVTDQYGRPLALEWMPYTQVVVDPDGLGVTYYRHGTDQPLWSPWWPSTSTVSLSWAEIVVFESFLTPVLSATRPLSTAARLDNAADRFASVDLAAGILKQLSGDDLTPAAALEQIRLFESSRAAHSVAYIPADLGYEDTGLDPDRLQLVEARSYQDAALARVCNVPAFAVGVGVPHESLTYKTAFTARADLVDFGIAPYIGVWEQTFSSDQITPHGTTVDMDLEPFLRTEALRTLTPATGGAQADTAAAPTEVGAP